jgi:hypothetical protein
VHAPLPALDIAVANFAASAPVQLDANPSNDAAGDIVVGVWDPSSRTFTPNLTMANAECVQARHAASSPGGPLSLQFGSAFGAPTTEVGVLGDPLVLALDPSGSGAVDLNGTPLRDSLALPLGPGGEIDDSGTYAPGYDEGGMSLQGSDLVNPQPGTNVFGGSGVTLTGGASLWGEGVTVLIDEGGCFDLAGHVVAHSTPASSGTFRMAGSPGKPVGALVVHRLENAGNTGFLITGTGLPPASGPELPPWSNRPGSG